MKNLFDCLCVLESNIKKGKKFYLVDSGICENVSHIGKKFFHYEIKLHIQEWKHFSGDSTYPIGGMIEYNTHKSNESLWKDDQLKLRLDLIKFLKSKLKASK